MHRIVIQVPQQRMTAGLSTILHPNTFLNKYQEGGIEKSITSSQPGSYPPDPVAAQHGATVSHQPNTKKSIRSLEGIFYFAKEPSTRPLEPIFEGQCFHIDYSVGEGLLTVQNFNLRSQG